MQHAFLIHFPFPLPPSPLPPLSLPPPFPPPFPPSVPFPLSLPLSLPLWEQNSSKDTNTFCAHTVCLTRT